MLFKDQLNCVYMCVCIYVCIYVCVCVCVCVYTFELWGWRRVLRVLWTARKSNQSILKIINPEYLLERLMLKL